MSGHLVFKPSSFYYRRAVRASSSVEELRDLALAVISEDERLREWVREQGLIPPKFTVHIDEAREKGWREGA